MTDASQAPGVAAAGPRGGHAGQGPASPVGEPPWAPLYNAVATMIGDGRLEADALVPPPGEAAALWSIPAAAARRAYTALERDGLLARCPDCRQWVVAPMTSCTAP